MRHVLKYAACSALAAALVIAPSHAGSTTFLKSDDHAEELVGKFLTDPDYTLMVEDLERNDVEFDWGWVKTPDGKLKKIKALGFDVASYKTVRIPAVQDFSDSLSPELAAKVHESFERAVKNLGLEVVADGKEAGLELGVAIIDLKREKTYAYVAMIDPYIKLEIRLKDVAKNENLLLVRNRAHSENPETAALKCASEMMKFLRN
jgi:hypothetical protein